MKEIVDNQRKYFNTDSTKGITFRIGQLQKLRDLLSANAQLLDAAIYSDFGKSQFETFMTEYGILFSEIDNAIKHLKKWAKPKRVSTDITNFPAKSYMMAEPLGVCLVIGAWNYPYQLSFAPAIAAIAAGNTIVLKPSEIPANTSHAMAKLINENFEPEFFKVVEGGIAETTELLEQKFDKIFFTGSTSVGKVVYQAAAKHLTPVTLELGGKSPVIVCEDAKLDITVKRLVWAKFLNAGQTCIAPDYVFVHHSIEKVFLEKLKQRIEKISYSVESGNYVQIINERNWTRIMDLIDLDKLYFGGESDKTKRYIAPTIMSGVSFEDKVMSEEIFGPVLPVMSYSSLDEVISQIKERPKPLSLYVYTNDKEKSSKILSKVSFGGGCVNDSLMHISNINLPFGGVGDSGIGSYHGEGGFKAFSHFKSILDKSTLFEPDFKYSPYTSRKTGMIKKIM